MSYTKINMLTVKTQGRTETLISDIPVTQWLLEAGDSFVYFARRPVYCDGDHNMSLLFRNSLILPNILKQCHTRTKNTDRWYPYKLHQNQSHEPCPLFLWPHKTSPCTERNSILTRSTLGVPSSPGPLVGGHQAEMDMSLHLSHQWMLKVKNQIWRLPLSSLVK